MQVLWCAFWIVIPAITFAGDLINYDIERLEAVREAVRDGVPEYVKAYRKLLDGADKKLGEPLYSVMDKTQVPPSGDKHDYLSLAPYWWPDPKKKDGLPWIRRDGEVNPETKDGNTDDQPKDRAVQAIRYLAWAAYFSADEKYGRQAIKQIHNFFLDPATRMNPSLNYAQGIPGLNSGRCFGIIETTGFQRVVTALELLQEVDMLPVATKTGMKQWFNDYSDWLLTSELGIQEGTRLNNHANWYDAQLVCYLRYTGRQAEARSILEAAKLKRIATQIEPDGSQPHELARTKSISYSRMNLEAMTRLAWHGEALGVDLWSFSTEDGRSLPAAYEYLRPYAFEGKEWTYQQLGGVEKQLPSLRTLFRETGVHLGVKNYLALVPSINYSSPTLEVLYFFPR